MSLFVTFEGTEGSGKTTQIRLLADRLRSLGREVVTTREPGGTALGEALRTLLLDSHTPVGPEAEAYLMTGARAEHVRRVIQPSLDRQAVVLSDRFYDSTLAYQGGGRGLSIEHLRAMQELAVANCRPGLTFLLDLPVEVGLERRARVVDQINRIDRESRAFHERVALWYRDEAQAHQDRWVIVDATRPPDVVHAQIMESVMQRLLARQESRLA